MHDRIPKCLGDLGAKSKLSIAQLFFGVRVHMQRRTIDSKLIPKSKCEVCCNAHSSDDMLALSSAGFMMISAILPKSCHTVRVFFGCPSSAPSSAERCASSSFDSDRPSSSAFPVAAGLSGLCSGQSPSSSSPKSSSDSAAPPLPLLCAESATADASRSSG